MTSISNAVDPALLDAARAARIVELRRDRERVRAELRDFARSDDHVKDHLMRGLLFRELANLDAKIHDLEAKR